MSRRITIHYESDNPKDCIEWLQAIQATIQATPRPESIAAAEKAIFDEEKRFDSANEQLEARALDAANEVLERRAAEESNVQSTIATISMADEARRRAKADKELRKLVGTLGDIFWKIVVVVNAVASTVKNLPF